MGENGETSETNGRTVSGTVATVLAVLMIITALYYAADQFRLTGLVIDRKQYMAGILGFGLALVFLTRRASKSSTRKTPPWYDIVFAVVGFATATYMAVRFRELNELQFKRPLDGLIPACIILPLIVEGVRRTVGPFLATVVTVFLFLPLAGPYFPGPMQVPPTLLAKLPYNMAWDPNGILGLPLAVAATIVIAFVFFGQVLLRCGGSEFFTELSMALVGSTRGGQAKISVVASSMFGSISGSAVANVATTGVITIPLMRKGGYSPYHAGAIEAVASTGGQLMPPIMGAAAFLMAEFLEVPYTEVVIAALVPALLYYVALFLLADLEPARAGIKPLDKAMLPKLGKVLRDGWFFPVPFAVLIITLFAYNYSPSKAALLSAIVILALSAVIGFRGRRLNFRGLFDAVRSTGFAVLDIIMIGAAAGIVISALQINGIGFQLTKILVAIGAGNLLLLLIIAAFVCILLGMGMPTAGVYVVLQALVAPALIRVGIEPMGAHLFILYFGMMSMITPPVAIAAFAASTLTGVNAMRTGFSAVKFGWVAYLLPFIFVTHPSLLLRGEAWVVGVDIATTILGIWLVSIGIIGFFTRLLNPVERIFSAVIGLTLFVPVHAFAGAQWAVIAATALGLALLARELLAKRDGRLRHPA